MWWERVENYIARNIAFIIYFAAFPILTSAIFALSARAFVEAIVLFLTAAGLFVASTIILESFFGRSSIRLFVVGSGVPLVLFLLFNLSVTAVYAHAAYSALRAEVSQLFFRDIATRVFSGYERIVPKLWVTAVLYASATLGFWLALRAQPKALRVRSRTDPDS